MPPIDGGPGSLPDTETEAPKVIEAEAPPIAEGAEAPAPKTDDAASSSEAPKGTDEHKTLLDATRAVVKPSVDAPAPSAKPKSEASAAESAAAAKPDGTGKPPAATDDKLLPFHNHPRFQQLIVQNRELQGDAKQFRAIDSFMTENGLLPQETAEGMIIMGLMKNDPQAAYDRLLPHMARLGEIIGKTLPDDLKKLVDEGLTTEDAAKETARLRRTAEAATTHTKQLENARQTEQVVQHGQAMKSAVDTWEATQRKSDPDFDRKAEDVQDRVRSLILQHGKPKTPADAVEYAKAAYKTVSERKKRDQPLKKTNTPPAQTHGSHAAAPVPKTFAEAVRLAAG